MNKIFISLQELSIFVLSPIPMHWKAYLNVPKFENIPYGSQILDCQILHERSQLVVFVMSHILLSYKKPSLMYLVTLFMEIGFFCFDRFFFGFVVTDGIFFLPLCSCGMCFHLPHICLFSMFRCRCF